MQASSGKVEKQHLAIGIGDDLDDANLRVAQLAMFGDFLGLVVVAQHPDFSGVVVAVDVRSHQFRQSLAAIDPTASDRSKVRMRMLDDRRDELRGTFRPFGTERVSSFSNAPAIVATFLDEVDHLPQVLSDFAAPHLTGRRVERELPNLPMTE